MIGAALLGVTAGAARADVYKFVDRRGVVHFSDKSHGPGWQRILKSGPGAKVTSKRPTKDSFARNQARYTPLIERMARRYRLDVDLVHAVIRAESAYDATAVSRAGAIGLMQLMPGTARRYGIADPRNPVQNVSAGVRYLRDLLREFRSVSLALAAYNAGEGAVYKYGKQIPPYPETRDYVRKVLHFYKQNRRAAS